MQNKIRVLEVVGGMNRAGTETWLMNILRNIDRDRFQIDFLVHDDKTYDYSREIEALGSRVIPCLNPRKPWIYQRNLLRILATHGPYDIVHSHVHHFSGLVLRSAYKAGIPTRVCHSHNDTSIIEAQAGILRRAYLFLMKNWINKYSTHCLAASRQAAKSLFQEKWEVDSRVKVMYCALDFSLFRSKFDRGSVRTELKIPLDAFVIGHIGRFEEQKNHKFLIEIFNEVVKKEPRAHLLLIGGGVLKEEISKIAKEYGLYDKVTFTGVRDDVPRLLMGAMDAFLFPSIHEGLGLALVEAQAAGLPCIRSDIIPVEVDIVKQLVKSLSLNESQQVWAETILTTSQISPKFSKDKALKTVENSPFNISIGSRILQEFYIDFCERPV